MTTAPADSTEVTLTFEDSYVLSTEDVDAFAFNWNDEPEPPPYYVNVDGHRFSYTGLTFLVRGHGAELPDWVKENEAEGRLVLFVERGTRLLAYVFDPSADTDTDQ